MSYCANTRISSEIVSILNSYGYKTKRFALTVTFPNLLVNQDRDSITLTLWSATLLLLLQYGRPLSMAYDSGVNDLSLCRCQNTFFTLTFQCGESEKVPNVTGSFQNIVVGGCRWVKIIIGVPVQRENIVRYSVWLAAVVTARDCYNNTDQNNTLTDIQICKIIIRYTFTY